MKLLTFEFMVLQSVFICSHWILSFRMKKFISCFVASTILNPALKVFVLSEILTIILERVLPMFCLRQEYVSNPFGDPFFFFFFSASQVTPLLCFHFCMSILHAETPQIENKILHKTFTTVCKWSPILQTSERYRSQVFLSSCVFYFYKPIFKWRVASS